MNIENGTFRDRVMKSIEVYKSRVVTDYKAYDFSPEDRYMIFKAWKDFLGEIISQDDGQEFIKELEGLKKIEPKMVKKRRRIDDGWEEFIEPVFADEDSSANIKLLEKAHEWKLKMEAAAANNDDDEEEDD